MAQMLDNLTCHTSYYQVEEKGDHQMNATFLKIGTLGTGRMASNLGELWAAKGHQVFLGSRDPQKAKELAQSIGPNVKGGSSAEAVAFGEVLALAVPWTAAEETLKALGVFGGKILIDMTNPIQLTDAGRQLLFGHTTSAAEQIATWAPDARVVKAFNSIYFENLEKPQFGPLNASSFFCGDDEQAKAVVARLSQDIGFDPVDCGPLANARLLEPLAVLWMQLAFSSHGSDIALKLLRR
jgi:NADPH-dependent F420 reductase